MAWTFSSVPENPGFLGTCVAGGIHCSSKTNSAELDEAETTENASTVQYSIGSWGLDHMEPTTKLDLQG